jgi:hypothetical protein
MQTYSPLKTLKKNECRKIALNINVFAKKLKPEYRKNGTHNLMVLPFIMNH